MQNVMSVILTLCSILFTASSAMALVSAPVDLTIKPPQGIKATKTLVAFSHTIHDGAKVECVTCHHTWDKKSEVKKCSTAGCHDQPGKKGINAFYTAFHKRKSATSCLGCHKDMKKQGKTVPVACKSCHPKR